MLCQVLITLVARDVCKSDTHMYRTWHGLIHTSFPGPPEPFVVSCRSSLWIHWPWKAWHVLVAWNWAGHLSTSLYWNLWMSWLHYSTQQGSACNKCFSGERRSGSSHGEDYCFPCKMLTWMWTSPNGDSISGNWRRLKPGSEGPYDY